MTSLAPPRDMPRKRDENPLMEHLEAFKRDRDGRAFIENVASTLAQLAPALRTSFIVPFLDAIYSSGAVGNQLAITISDRVLSYLSSTMDDESYIAAGLQAIPGALHIAGHVAQIGPNIATVAGTLVGALRVHDVTAQPGRSRGQRRHYQHSAQTRHTQNSFHVTPFCPVYFR